MNVLGKKIWSTSLSTSLLLTLAKKYSDHQVCSSLWVRLNLCALSKYLDWHFIHRQRERANSRESTHCSWTLIDMAFVGSLVPRYEKWLWLFSTFLKNGRNCPTLQVFLSLPEDSLAWFDIIILSILTCELDIRLQWPLLRASYAPLHPFFSVQLFDFIPRFSRCFCCSNYQSGWLQTAKYPAVWNYSCLDSLCVGDQVGRLCLA